MTSHIPAKLRRLVIRRNGGRCEYCHLSQAGQEATFHIDHITPVTAGGETLAENLALDLNRPLIPAIREEEAALGRHL